MQELTYHSLRAHDRKKPKTTEILPWQLQDESQLATNQETRTNIVKALSNQKHNQDLLHSYPLNLAKHCRGNPRRGNNKRPRRPPNKGTNKELSGRRKHQGEYLFINTSLNAHQPKSKISLLHFIHVLPFRMIKSTKQTL